MSKDLQYLREGLISVGLFLFSICVGLGLNSLRSFPLPLVYQAPVSRFQRAENKQLSSPGITVIDVATAQSLVAPKAALVLDGRPDLFFEFGLLPGAFNLSKKNCVCDNEKISPKIVGAAAGVLLLLYCAHAHCEDASKVAGELEETGHQFIPIYKGGYDEWERHGLKSEKRI